MSRALSKSLYIRGLQCHKSLYLHKYQPEFKDEISEEQEALFNAGHEVGGYAKQLFPGGVEIPYEGLTHSEQIEKTMAEIEKGTTTLYEAAFSHNGVFVKVDILHKGQEGWNIYEVKSSTGIKYVHLDDIAVQYYVVSGSGLRVSSAHLVHINNQYVRNGTIEPAKLFTIADVTPAAEEKQSFVEQKIAELQTMLGESIPDVGIGEYCKDPYPCDFQGHCWQHIPRNSVFDLRRKGANKFGLYRQGIVEMKDIPLDILNKSQRTQVDAFLNKSEKIDKSAIAKFLDTLSCPVCFLDFETIYTAIPLFDGTRPYQQIPFQFSLHLIENAESELQHFEFLAKQGADPRRELVDRLLEMIPSNACIVTYTDFEAKRMRDLSKWFPEYRESIEGLIENIRDLSTPFKQMDYYHWQMNGSYSIKKVLPQLVTDMSYEGMEICNGGMAIDAYFRMRESSDPAEIAGIRKALLDYCKLDTLAMVKILERLREMCQ
ncbi:MAG: DUF2779 domain-containing protein [Nitrospirae bacterium]|nr:DUF2779 domain-containing protein [Nitrospirota bacterium]